MNFKKYILGTALATTALFSSCNDKFEEMNQNPWTSNNLDSKHLFTFSQLKMFASGHEGWRANLIMAGSYAENTANLLSSGVGFNLSDGYTNSTWELIYGDVIKNITDAVNRLEEEGGQDDKIAQFRIVKAVNMLRLTLMYGDIPYFNAGKGASELVYYPEYDAQEDILNDLVNELKESRDILLADGSNVFTYDLYTSKLNDAEKYVKLANSLLMRIGLTMSEADKTTGTEIFTEAYNNTGGYIQNWNDAVYVEHSIVDGPWGQHVNGTGVAVEGQVGGFSYAYLSDKALQAMQKNQDPRIFRLASHLDYSGGVNKAMTDASKYTDFDPFATAGESGEYKKVHFRGVRMGNLGDGNRGMFYAEDEGKVIQASYFLDQNKPSEKPTEGYKNYQEFEKGGQFITLAGLSPATFNRLAPSIVMGADEMQFMIAEASILGMVGADAKTAFQSGVELALAKYDAVGFPGKDAEVALETIYKAQTNSAYDHDQAVSAYVNNALTRYDNASDKRDVIVYEHWISNIGNGYKSFQLWNRTHMPTMVVNNVKAAGQDVIDLPIYSGDATVDGFDLTVGQTKEIELHTGGVTDGVRPKRFPYPSRELTVNLTNVESAMNRQRTESGNAGEFTTVEQWYSKK